ncbi:unnamed protein product [Calypogeia fissa]
MGSGPSRLRGCFRPRYDYYDGGTGVQFSEPLDEGLGHSFCYVRPYGSPPPVTPDRSEELVNGGKHGPVMQGADDPSGDGGAIFPMSSKDDKEYIHDDKGKLSGSDRPRVSSEKPKNATNEKIRNVPETSFKAISGASVSANTATPRTINNCEQFNSFSNFLYDRAAAFESTSSFSAIPLQPVPRGFSGPLSGPLDKGDRGFMSGPLERERGFLSGPLERGFMSGPLERGSMSGPMDCSVDRSHFSAPLNASYHDSGYFRKRRKSLVQFVTNVSGPLKKAFSKTASSLAKTHKSFVSPVRNYMFLREKGREPTAGTGDKRGLDPVDPSVEFSATELDVRGSDNLQWAQGKAGEDRVHVVISEEQGWIFVGIYDGFNGPDAPDFLMSNLYPAVSQELEGLLWDSKEEPRLPVEDGEEIKQFNEGEAVGHRPGDGGEQGCYWRRSQTAGGDVIQTEHAQQEVVGFNVGQKKTKSGNGQYVNEETAPIGMDGASEKDISALSVDDSRHLECKDGMCDLDQISCGACSDPDTSRMWGDHAEGGTCTISCEEEEHREVLTVVGGIGRHERFATEESGKLAEDWGHEQVEEIENERSSDLPEYSEASSVSEQDHNRKKKRTAPGMRHRYCHNRRKEQLRKYLQWRYDLDQEQTGLVQKVKNAKIAQEPDSPGKGNAVEHDSVLKALARALENTENAYLDMADKVLYENPELALMGSCVLVMLMKDEDMYILNVGDSRAILAQHPKVEPLIALQVKGGRNGVQGNDTGARDSLLRLELERIIEETPMELEALESHENGSVGAPILSEPSLLGALQLTTDHSTNIKEEVVRLRAEHPDDDTIENDRVKGKLKVTRAFGAGFLKQPKWNNALLEMFQINFIGTAPYVTCSPALYHHRLGPRDEFLVLSSDGLYQYFTNEEVVSHVESFMKKFPDGDPAQHLIEELLFRAAKKAGMDFHELLDIPQGDRRKYHDDVSVMVISLEGRIWRSSG